MGSPSPLEDVQPGHAVHSERHDSYHLDEKSIAGKMDQATKDAMDLAALGHTETLTRKFSVWSMLALASLVLGTWAVMAQDLNNGLTFGGPIAILWGLCLVTFCNLCVALSLGELCSSMPTALGQAFYISHLWKSPYGRFASYMCAWINTFGWWTLTASQTAFMTEFVLSFKAMFDEDYDVGGTGWIEFLVYIGMAVSFTLFNLAACRKDSFMGYFNNFMGLWFAALFFAFALAIPISVGIKQPELAFQRASFVFGKWLNRTGWSDGVVWFLGLVQSAYGLTAFDAVIHMIEEIPAPRRNAPITMCLSIGIGAISGFIFMVICLFCIQDMEVILNPPTGFPFFEITSSTVGLTGGAVLIGIFVANGFGQGIQVMTSASRLTWSFARDGGIPFGRYFGHVDPTWKVPARALWLQCAIVSLVGVLYLFADFVLQAIVSVSTIALTISYLMPILTIFCLGRDKMPPREFDLGRFGPVVNVIAIIYCSITSVFFFFPTLPNPSVTEMNYAIAVFGVMLAISLGFWVFQGRRTFMGITDEIEGQLAVGQGVEQTRVDASVHKQDT